MSLSYRYYLLLFMVTLPAFMSIPASAGVSVQPAGVREGFKTALITVPYARHKPDMTSGIRDAEWKDAVSLTALQTTTGAVSARQSRFWMMWDEDNLYLAMRSPLRPGERLIQSLRARDRDLNAVFDDSYEIWLDLGTLSPDGQPVFFQYLSNFAGARFDVMHEPAVGNSRLGWTAGWKPYNHLSADGHAWEMMLAIPRTSLYKNQPFQEGFAFTCLLSRNYKRPWEQVTIGGSGSFSVRETHPRFVLLKSVPALHLLSVGDAANRSFGLELAACGSTSQTIHWTFESDGGVKKEGDLAVKPDESSPLRLPSLDKEGAGSFRIRVTSEDRQHPLLDWSAFRQFGNLQALKEKLQDRGDQVQLTLDFNPVRDYLHVSGDFIDYDARDQIARCQVDVRRPDGKLVASKPVKIDALSYAQSIVQLPKIGPGKYKAELVGLAADGHTLLKRETDFMKKDLAREYPWWNTTRGNAEKVLAPWTPVASKNGAIQVWGRQIRLGTAGLPAQILTQGQELLTGPMCLSAVPADGKPLQARGTRLATVQHRPNRLVMQAGSKLGTVAVDSLITIEYDGMIKCEIRLDPKKPIKLRSLQLVVPMKTALAEYLHASGEGIRYGFDYRLLADEKHGRIWDSRRVDGQPMAIGSFIPSLWIGSSRGGLSWFADSDQGWEPNNTTPAIEVRRDVNGRTDLILNIISSETTLNQARKIIFAFQPTPVKPIFDGWRMDTWWTGDTFKDWAQLESKGKAGDMGLIFSSIPFPLDPEVSRQMAAARHQETSTILGAAGPKYHANAVPYFEHINMGDRFAPEMNYFGEEWRTRVSRGLSYGKPLADYMVYNITKSAETGGIDGFYLDNVFPIADNNLDAGRGYLLKDGQIQPTYQMFDTRLYLLRLRAALLEQHRANKLVLHMTNHLVGPWIGAADIALDGEHHVIFPEMGKDFMDFWSRERLRLDNPAAWGVAVNFLQEYQGNWQPEALKKVMRSYSGMALLHDVLASANANSQNPEVWKARERFQITDSDVRFIAYWNQNNGLKSSSSEVSVSGWQHTSSNNHGTPLLLAVVNTGEAADAVITIHSAILRLPDPKNWRLVDAETGAPYVVDGSGRFTVPIPRHDYRQVLLLTGNGRFIP